MEIRLLGRTGLRATVAGLGSGGFSRLGMGQDKGDANAEQVVRAALDAGINLIDTAEGYGTEAAIGNALAGLAGADRDRLILSTKLSYRAQDRLKTPAEVVASLDASLQRLRTDHVEIYFVHGVRVDHYLMMVETIVPELLRQRDRGKLRFIGITEGFSGDTGHKTLRRAVQDDCWDAMMVGFNLLNTSAREMLFPATRAKGIATLCMFAVRQALIDVDRLDAYLRQQVAESGVDARVLESIPLLREVLASGQCGSLTEAAYRFCLYEPGLDCVLTGTGSPEHLRQNVRSLQQPPLPPDFLARIGPLFAGITAMSGQ
jgi:aryl-alcohol dehydrogenase-like predicted oxidoreductase